MSKTIQNSKRITWINDSGDAVLAGSPVVLGNMVFVALENIADSATGELGIGEVYSMPKVSGAVIGQGETVHFDLSSNAFDDNQMEENDGDILNGAIAWKAAGDGETSVDVFLSPAGGTIGVTPEPP